MSDPVEYAPDEEPGDDDRALWAEAAADQARQEAEGITGIGWDNLGHDRDEDREGWPDV